MKKLHHTLYGQILVVLRWCAPLGMAVLCFWALKEHVGLPSLSELGDSLAALPAWKWAGACVLTALSFWALGRYDSVAHRHLRSRLDGPRAQTAGMAAIAFSQTAGFGLITGAYARWRLLPGLSPLQAAQITALVGFTFMVTLSAISGIALILVPVLPGTGWLGFALLAAFCTALAASFFFPALRIGKLKLRWPSLIAMSALLGWTALDVIAAGSALWLLLPQTADIAWSTLITVYFVALGAAILSSAPGGAGPLELTVCALLPDTDTAALLAALVAFRIVYYALPAALASALMLLPRRRAKQAKGADDAALMGCAKRPADALPADRARAEVAIIRQNGGHVQLFGFNQLAILDSPQSSIAFFDPISGLAEEIFVPFRAYGQRRNGTVCIYKCGPRIGTAARQARWKVLRIAQEAVLRPQSFADKGSTHRQLRRKLRHAKKAGVVVTTAGGSLPLDQMGMIDELWQSTHGTAYGTTMGRFEQGYLARQKIFLAWKDGHLEGFVSLHHSPQEWCLDLIRIRPDAPDGTSHALVRAAIAEAADDAIPRFSLAAVPDHRWAKKTDPGLRRFKACFAPVWEPRYITAPTWGHMLLSLAEILRLVLRPDPIHPVPASDTSKQADWKKRKPEPPVDGFVHNELEQKAFALNGTP